MKNQFLKISFLTALALIAFAGNSVLCRLALGENMIDASSFTMVRLLSGALVLVMILSISKKKLPKSSKGNWTAGFMLFLYAVSFSYAYLTLDTGTGALILFGAVQITIIILSMWSGHRLNLFEWLGVLLAFFGFVYLIFPELTSPSMFGFILMSLAGIAWGVYTLKGQESTDPLIDTAFNFLRTLPFVLILFFTSYQYLTFTREGIILAVISGGITSGIGYTIWYMAIEGLSKIQTAVVQLLVPIIAAFGGVIFVSEKISFRLTMASVFVLGGILMVVLAKNKNSLRNNP